MQTNMVLWDRALRVFVGMGVFGGGAALGTQLGMPAITILGILIGLFLTVVGFIGFCPAYIFLKKVVPQKPQLTPAEQRHGNKMSIMLSNPYSDRSGAEARMASNRSAFRDK